MIYLASRNLTNSFSALRSSLVKSKTFFALAANRTAACFNSGECAVVRFDNSKSLRSGKPKNAAN